MAPAPEVPDAQRSRNIGTQADGPAAVRHLGRAPFLVIGAAFEPVLRGAAVLLVFYGILRWMYRRSIFIRI